VLGRRALPAVVLVALAASCKVYDESLLLPGDASVAPVGPGDGVGWWSGGEGQGCFSAGVPKASDRPAPSQGGTDLPPLAFAITRMRLGATDKQGQPNKDAWQDIGFDLDGMCTGSPTCDPTLTQNSCKPASIATPYDGDYCRDNTFGRLQVMAQDIKEIGGKYGLSEDAFNCALCTGAYNFIFRISGYNGEANDDSVRVDLYPSPGLENPYPWDCSQPDWTAHPCFRSDDAFTIEDDSMPNPAPGPDLAEAKLYDPSAFVRDGYIVAQLPESALFWFPGTNALAVAFPITIKRGLVAGKIGKAQDGTWQITDGTIAGASTAQDIIHGFRLIGFCDADPNYQTMVSFLTSNLDILSTGQNSPDTPCDALSLGIEFEAKQATVGKLAAVTPLTECVSPKGDGGADAATDGADESGSDAADETDGAGTADASTE
jgi:hypothetical protein